MEKTAMTAIHMRSDTRLEGLFRAHGSPYRKRFALEGRPLRPAELFRVLDLEQPGLEPVRAAFKAGGRDAAAKALLSYFRNREHVAWPAWPALDNFTHFDAVGEGPPSDEPPPGPLKASALPRLSIADKDRAVAANARRHIFQPNVEFAPHNFGPDIDWDENPYDAISWTTGMHHMRSWDLPVARCYNAAQDPSYARLWTDLTGDWIRKNPITKERCYYPQSWDSIQVGFRARRWSGLLPYFLAAPAFTPDFLVELLAALYNHARRIVVLPYVNPDNFLIIESATLADIALAFPEFLDAGEWRAKAFDRLAETLRGQVLPDGVHHELTPGYHRYCALLFLDAIDLARRNGFEPPFLKAVEGMAQAVFGWASPMRLDPIVGDTLRPDARRVLMRAAHIFKRSDFLAAATDGAKGSWPAQRNFAFRSAGFYAFRSDWTRNAIWLALHCGPRSGDPTACHAQPDNGTFELAAFGRYLMRDPGVYSYNWNHPEERAPFRATAAHQTLTLDGADSARAGRCLDWCAEDGHGHAWLTVENRAYPGLIHRRTVFFVARRWFVLVDEACGDAAGVFDLHFQLTPGPARVDVSQKSARTDFPTGGNVLVWADSQAPVDLREEEGWFSAALRQKERLPSFRYRHRQSAPARFLTLLVPFRGCRPPDASATVTAGRIGGARLEIRTRVDKHEFTLQRRLTAQ